MTYPVKKRSLIRSRSKVIGCPPSLCTICFSAFLLSQMVQPLLLAALQSASTCGHFDIAQITTIVVINKREAKYCEICFGEQYGTKYCEKYILGSKMLQKLHWGTKCQTNTCWVSNVPHGSEPGKEGNSAIWWPQTCTLRCRVKGSDQLSVFPTLPGKVTMCIVKGKTLCE